MNVRGLYFLDFPRHQIFPRIYLKIWILKCWKGIFISAFCKPIIPEFKSQKTWLITQKTLDDFEGWRLQLSISTWFQEKQLSKINKSLKCSKVNCQTLGNIFDKRSNFNLKFQRGQFKANSLVTLITFDETGNIIRWKWRGDCWEEYF